ncbi:MAG: hypothetical protein ACJ73S_28280 [Mycobacteriales bacterium]
MDQLLLGRATVDVTPPPGHPLGGYLARGEQLAAGTHDPLEAGLLWLGTADEPGVVWLALDTVAVDEPLAAGLGTAVGAALGVPADRVLVCASHTHSGPADWTGSLHPGLPGGPDPDAVARLVEAVVEGAAGLVADRRPVTASWASRPAPGVGANRTTPDGPHDDSAGVLTLRDTDGGEVVAVLCDFASHPTVLGPDNLRYSADWPGAARHAIAGALGAVGPRPAVAFLQGAAGDASSRFVRVGQDFAEAARIGGLYAASVLGAVLGREQRPLAGPPAVHHATAELPVRGLPAVDELRAQIAEAGLVATETGGRDRRATTRYEGLLLLDRLRAAGLPDTLRMPLTAVTLGDVAWIHLPVELFASYAAALRAASPFPVTRVIGYTGGYFGYVADVGAHRAGTYEAYMSLIEPDAADRLVDAAAALLRHAWDVRPHP